MRVSFLFCRRVNGFKGFSWILEKVQGVTFSHEAIQVWDDYVHDEPMIFESVFPKAQRILRKKWLLNPFLVVEEYQFKIRDPKVVGQVRKELYAGVGKRYSLFQIGLIAVTLVFKSLEPWIGKKNWNGKKFLHCTEYGARVKALMGHKFNESLDTIDLIESRDACREMQKQGVHSCL